MENPALVDAYAAAQQQPLEAVKILGVSEHSPEEAVRQAFVRAYEAIHGGGLRCQLGRDRLEAAVELFMEKRHLADFVARYCAGLSIGELIAEA